MNSKQNEISAKNVTNEIIDEERKDVSRSFDSEISPYWNKIRISVLSTNNPPNDKEELSSSAYKRDYVVMLPEGQCRDVYSVVKELRKMDARFSIIYREEIPVKSSNESAKPSNETKPRFTCWFCKHIFSRLRGSQPLRYYS